MSCSDDEYEYDYSEDEDFKEEDDDDDDNMDWKAQPQPQQQLGNGDNPNAPPIAVTTIPTSPSPKKISAKCSLPKLKTGIRMLPCEDLVPEMDRKIHDVTEVLDIPVDAAPVLLREHNWSKELLLEAYYNNSTKLLQKCGVYARCTNQKALTTPSPSAPNKRKNSSSKACGICYETGVEFLSMPCGHEFCTDCWDDFCANTVAEDGPACVRTTCPQAGCKEVITETEMAAADRNRNNYFPKFKTYQLRNFVESNTLSRWCPGKGCERVACASSASAMEHDGNVAQCDACTIRFCMICGEEPHAPCGCKDLASWKEKCRNESETANWILANTKSCPKCVTRIEKNQGCNHMTCQRCKYEFCWICMGDWNDHGANTGGYYKCNKFDPNNSAGLGASAGDDEDMSDVAKAKRELDRYLHYYKRFHAHSEAQKFATKQLKETETRMVQLQEANDDAKWSDVEFLKTANEQLVECRRILKYTYVFAYCWSGGPNTNLQKERFEHHQEMLERFTENLSELSEKPLPEMSRTDVVNQTRVVDRFMKNILKYVEDGMDDI